MKDNVYQNNSGEYAYSDAEWQLARNADDMISVRDLNDNIGRLVSLAHRGRRIVVVNDNEPIAAIIGISDLRSLPSGNAPSAPASADPPSAGPGVPATEHARPSI